MDSNELFLKHQPVITLEEGAIFVIGFFKLTGNGQPNPLNSQCKPQDSSFY